jgi:aerobic C4-dicarboxylate transport protein
VFKLIDEASHAIFGMVNIVMKVAPIGAFGAMAFTIGKYGVASLPLAKLMGLLPTCGLFVVVVLGAVARLTGFSIVSSSCTSGRTADRAGHQLVGRPCRR